jgi:hypothetical protein
MPQTLPPGPTEFVVANIGDVPHNFEIEGQGIERVFEQDLQPGERETMQVELEPGEYEVYCPVGNHAEMGMRLTLRVSEEAQQQAEPTPAPEEETADVSATPTVTDTAEITDTAEGAPGTPITATAGITDTAMVTGTGVMTEAVVLRAGDRAITQQEFEQMFLDTLRSFTARTGLPVNVLTLPLFEELRTRYLA